MEKLVDESCWRAEILNDFLLKLYHRLPAPGRTAAASWRGRRLRKWRYGPDTERLVAEAFERERWSAERWRTWRQESLGYLLHHAATKVPYYREQWARRRRQGDCASWEYLENWAVLDKEPLRANPRAFVADDCNLRQMFFEHTSGTSGKSLDLWRSRESQQMRYALHEARWLRWHNVTGEDCWAMLGGQLVAPVAQRKPPFWVWNAASNQLYMSSYHLAPDLIPHYLDALARYEVKYVWGYTSSLYALAQETLRLGRRDISLSVAITNAEPLFDYQRQAITEAFSCPVRETYGMTEFVAAGGECEHGKLHLWADVGIVETMEGDAHAARGTIGDYVCTGLINPDMPLIRYRVGDRGTAPTLKDVCACGRTLPVITSLDGRVDDVLYTRDGRAVGRLDPIFKNNLPIREAQIVQETLDSVRVRYVPTAEWTSAAGRSIVERLQARMGAVEVVLESLDEVPRTINGKFRAVVCNLSPEQKRSLENRN